jgi:beta-glucosidase
MKKVHYPDRSKDFPKNFVWGVSTSAFQIEGAAARDGKGPSIWDTFCKQPGAIADHSNGDIACDHYSRLDSDLDLIASLGVDAYRFSMAWPRVQPLGKGAWNSKGVDFYDRLIDGLLERGLQACLTLNHWDLPQALQDTGGWANRDTVFRFVDYAVGVHERFGDRLTAITTHNEPWVIAILGHETGIFAPGLKSRKTAMQVVHHLLLSHGLAVNALRQSGFKNQLGIVLNLSPIEPASSSLEDKELAHLEDGRLVRFYMDPIFKKSYPQDVMASLGSDAPVVNDGDLEAIGAPIDFLGVNYYTRAVVSAKSKFDVRSSGLNLTDMEWEIYPSGLTDLLVRLHRDYPVPALYVTENGGAFKDPYLDGAVHDNDRIEYLSTHIAAVASAIKQGVPMRGYAVWSLMDNFEWASGYAKRFGIIHVDYATQKRTLKDSALWYRAFLQGSVVQQEKSAALMGGDI